MKHIIIIKNIFKQLNSKTNMSSEARIFQSFLLGYVNPFRPNAAHTTINWLHTPFILFLHSSLTVTINTPVFYLLIFAWTNSYLKSFK